MAWSPKAKATTQDPQIFLKTPKHPNPKTPHPYIAFAQNPKKPLNPKRSEGSSFPK